MKQFNIFGTIVDSESEKTSIEDVCPNDFQNFISQIEDGEEIEIDINSGGGSVYAGVKIANMIKTLKNKTIAKVDSICASIATCIMCACDNIIVDENSFIMIHNCWSVVEGDCNTLRKEADTMEKMNTVIKSYYKSKFSKTDEELTDMMNLETWIQGKDATEYMRCEVIKTDEPIKLAAMCKKFNISIKGKFMNKDIETEIEKAVEEKETVETIAECGKEEVKSECGECEKKAEEEIKEETVVEEVKEEVEEKEPTVEELKEVIKQLEEKIALLESEKDTPVEERVSGMQAKMQKQINAQKKEFTDKMASKDKELADYKAQLSTMSNELAKSKKELSDMTSAFEDKQLALAVLNANVNTPNIEDSWKNLKGKEFFDWCKTNGIR